MDIICEILKPSELRQYTDLISAEIFYLARNKNVRTVAAYLSEGSNRKKAGILQYEIVEEKLHYPPFSKKEITWLYVDERFRRQGAGSRLLGFMLDESSQDNAKEIDVRLGSWKLIDTSEDEFSAFLMKAGFDVQPSDTGVFFMEGRDVFREAVLAKKELSQPGKNVVSFGRMTADSIASAAESFSRVSKDRFLRADRNLSFIYGRGASFDGVLLAEKYLDTICLSRLISKNSAITKELIQAFLMGLSRQMLFSDSLVINDASDLREQLSGIFTDDYYQEDKSFTLNIG